jgi:site-specific DNA recombinase
MLAAISQFYSDQLSIRTAEGVERRVRTGLFSGWAPYGYDNYRENGRGLVRVNREEANNVRRIFDLYAYHQHSLDNLVSTLRNEGRLYSEKHPDFVRSKLYSILTDRSYIGEIKFRGEWVEGKHEHIVDLATFDRVQVLLGNKSHHRHQSVYGSGLIVCGHCGRPILCETKYKRGREYQYYRCSSYNKGDHPRERTTGIELDKQMLALFDKLRISDKKVLQWLQRVIRAKMKTEVADNTAQLHEINRQTGQINKDRDALLNLRMHGEIEADTFARKDSELRNLSKRLKLRLDGQEQQKTEIGDTAMKVLELSQHLKEKWFAADIAEKRVILEIVCLNLTRTNATREIAMRKPFDAIAEGPVLINGAEERT